MHTKIINIDIILARVFQKRLSDPTRAQGFIDNRKDMKLASKRKYKYHDYHVQGRKYVQHKSVYMPCASTQFQALLFCGPHAQPHRFRGVIKHYHL